MSTVRNTLMNALTASLVALCLSGPSAAKPDNLTAHLGSPEMTEAVSQAKASLPRILKITQKTDTTFSKSLLVKVSFPVEGGTESIWVGGVMRAGETFAGQLANAPRFLPDAALGSDVVFDMAQIIDWAMPSRDGLYYGHYTTRVLANEAEGDRRKSLLSVLTPTPVPSHW